MVSFGAISTYLNDQVRLAELTALHELKPRRTNAQIWPSLGVGKNTRAAVEIAVYLRSPVR